MLRWVLRFAVSGYWVCWLKLRPAELAMRRGQKRKRLPRSYGSLGTPAVVVRARGAAPEVPKTEVPPKLQVRSGPLGRHVQDSYGSHALHGIIPPDHAAEKIISSK